MFVYIYIYNVYFISITYHLWTVVYKQLKERSQNLYFKPAISPCNLQIPWKLELFNLLNLPKRI